MKKRGLIVQLLATHANTLFSICSGLIFVPLYFTYFSVSTYGTWLATGNILNMLSILEGGLNTVSSQILAKSYEEKEYKDYSKTAASSLFLSMVIGLIILVVGCWVGYFLDRLLPNRSDVLMYDVKLAFVFAAAAAAISLLHNSMLSISKSWHTNEVPSVIGLVGAVVGLVSLYIALVHFNWGVAALGLGAFIKAVFNGIATFVYTFHKWQQKKLPQLELQSGYTKKLGKKMLPLLTANFAGITLNNSRELLIAILINPASAAILAITGRLYAMVHMLVNPISFSSFAALSSVSANIEKFSNWVKKLFHFHFLLSGVLFFTAFVVNGWFIAAWVGSAKFGGIFLSGLLCLAAWLVSKNSINIIVLNAAGIFHKTAYIAIVDLLIRCALIGLIVLFKLPFVLVFLPLVEIIADFIAFVYLEKIVNQEILFKQLPVGDIKTWWGSIAKAFFYCMFFAIPALIVAIFLYGKDDLFSGINSWWVAIFGSILMFSVYVVLVTISKSNRALFVTIYKSKF